MTARASGRARAALRWIAVGVALFLVEYLVASNVNVNAYWTSDAGSYGQNYSYLPLSSSARQAAIRLAPVLLFPIRSLIRISFDAPPRHWSKFVYRAVFPFSEATVAAERLNIFVFATLNTAAWLLLVGLGRLMWRFVSRRRSGGSAGEAEIGTAG